MSFRSEIIYVIILLIINEQASFLSLFLSLRGVWVCVGVWVLVHKPKLQQAIASSRLSIASNRMIAFWAETLVLSQNAWITITMDQLSIHKSA